MVHILIFSLILLLSAISRGIGLLIVQTGRKNRTMSVEAATATVVAMETITIEQQQEAGPVVEVTIAIILATNAASQVGRISLSFCITLVCSPSDQLNFPKPLQVTLLTSAQEKALLVPHRTLKEVGEEEAVVHTLLLSGVGEHHLPLREEHVVVAVVVDELVVQKDLLLALLRKELVVIEGPLHPDQEEEEDMMKTTMTGKAIMAMPFLVTTRME